MRKVFLDDLPRTKGFGANKDKDIIDWENSENYIVQFIYEDIQGEIKIGKYERKGQYINAKYGDKDFRIKTGNFSDCKIGRVLNKITSDFRIEIGRIFIDDKRNLRVIGREYREKNRKLKEKIGIEKQKWYKVKCERCGWNEGWIEESTLINGGGCSCCKGRTVVAGINDIATTNPEMLKYLLNAEDGKKYNKYSQRSVWVKCKDCEKTKKVVVSDLYSNKSIGCFCGDRFSRGHKYICQLLTQLNISFLENHRPTWCKYYNKYKKRKSYGEYDFFIEEMNLIIEVDGGFHRQDNNMSGQSREEIEYIDNKKDVLAKANGYRVIRIPYGKGDFRLDILSTEIINVFDLSMIDWLKCEMISQTNRAKEVCAYWMVRKEEETTKSLAKIFGVNNSTIHSYLKKGTEIGWCKYSAEEENRKNNEKTKERNRLRRSRKVEVFKDGESKGVFHSITSLSNSSEELFGTKLDIANVSCVCRGKANQSKGYTFKYVEDLN